MGINISIIAGENEKESSVTASGTVQHIITDTERKTFKLSDAELKSAVSTYFGKSPNDAYLHSPTPWGDLYKTYGWPQVQVVLVVQSAKVLGITSEPVIVKSQEFDNNSSQKATFNAGITESVSDTTTSSWSTGGTLTIGQKFTYDVKFLGVGGGGETSLSYSQSWGIGGQETKSVTLGSSSGVSVQLDPGEAVVAELAASRGAMKVEIVYNAYLIGSTAINYNPTYKDHHFWGLDLRSVMASAKVINSIASTEVIEIGYYSNSKIELKNKKTGSLVSTHDMANAPGH